MIAYKVVRETKKKGAYHSVYARNHILNRDDNKAPVPAGRTYKVGRKTTVSKFMKSKDYGLLVFDTLEHAVRFYIAEKSSQKSKLTIFKVEVDSLRNPTVHKLSSVLDGFFFVLSYIGTDFDWPYGTQMCNSVTLIEEVTI